MDEADAEAELDSEPDDEAPEEAEPLALVPDEELPLLELPAEDDPVAAEDAVEATATPAVAAGMEPVLEVPASVLVEVGAPAMVRRVTAETVEPE